MPQSDKRLAGARRITERRLMSVKIETAEKRHNELVQRHKAALAKGQEAAAEVERLAEEIANAPPSEWPELVGPYVQTLGLKQVAQLVSGVLARRRHAALVAVHEARVKPVKEAAEEAFAKAQEAKAAARQARDDMLRFNNGGYAGMAELDREGIEELGIKLKTTKARLQAEGAVADRRKNDAWAKAREAERALEAVKAGGPTTTG